MIRYAKPRSLDEALALLGEARWKILAGGTDFYPALGNRPLAENVLDINGLAARRGVSETASHIIVGARTTWTELIRHPLPPAFDALKQAAKEVGSTQIQNMASVAGNLCNASPAADSVPAMIAAGATATIVGAEGRREVPVEQIPVGPGRTSLKKGEVIVAVTLPPRKVRSGDAYLRFIPRTEMDIAVVGVGVNLSIDESGTCTAARVAIGAVAPTALLVPEAGASLVGTRLDEAALDKAAAAVRAACRPIDDKRGTAEYRTRISSVIFKRAAAMALSRAKA